MAQRKRPLIAVPVTEKREREIIEAFKRLSEKGADLIEWRADCFLDLDDKGAVERILSSSPDNLLFTVRTKSEGGFFTGSEDDYHSILGIAAKTKRVSIIDLEIRKASSSFVNELRSFGARVLVSYHDFSITPSIEEMEDILCSMKESGADILKLAVTAQNEEDAIRLLSLSESFKRNNPDCDIVTISMGNYGILSRIGGFLTGSCITFAAEDKEKASAPGQLTLVDMKNVLSIIERNL